MTTASWESGGLRHNAAVWVSVEFKSSVLINALCITVIDEGDIPLSKIIPSSRESSCSQSISIVLISFLYPLR